MSQKGFKYSLQKSISNMHNLSHNCNSAPMSSHFLPQNPLQRKIDSTKGKLTYGWAMRVDSRADSPDGWICPDQKPSSLARSILEGVEKFLETGVYGRILPRPVRTALYTLHNDVYRRTDGNNRLESKYLTLFRAMFRLPKSAGNSEGGWRGERWRRREAAAENWIWNRNQAEKGGKGAALLRLREKETAWRCEGWRWRRVKTISSRKHFVLHFECYSRNLEYVFLVRRSLDSRFVLGWDRTLLAL